MASPSITPSPSDWDEMAKFMQRANGGPSLRPSDALLVKMNALSTFSQASAILDTGCGGGSVTSRLIALYGPNLPTPTPRIFACDMSAGMVNSVKVTAEKEAANGNPIWSNVDTGVFDAQDLTGLEDNSFSHAMGGLVFFMVRDPQLALTETKRVLKQGGVLGLTSWKSSQWADLMSYAKDGNTTENGLKTIIPGAWMTTGGVEQELKTAGYHDVHAVEVDADMPYESHEELCHFFVTCMPHIKVLLKDWTPAAKDELEQRMVRHMKEMSPQAPGVLRGTAIAAVGRK